MSKSKAFAVLFALLAAVFYAISTPISKTLLQDIGPVMMAAFLYLGAGVGIGVLSLFGDKKKQPREKLTKSDLPYTIGMILLDIIAPILLMSFGYAVNDGILSDEGLIDKADRMLYGNKAIVHSGDEAYAKSLYSQKNKHN